MINLCIVRRSNWGGKSQYSLYTSKATISPDNLHVVHACGGVPLTQFIGVYICALHGYSEHLQNTYVDQMAEFLVSFIHRPGLETAHACMVGTYDNVNIKSCAFTSLRWIRWWHIQVLSLTVSPC